MEWLSRAFGFREHYRYGEPSGAQMRLGNAYLMVRSAQRNSSSSPAQHASEASVRTSQRQRQRQRQRLTASAVFTKDNYFVTMMCRFKQLYLLTPFALDGRREGGGLRALDKVVNSLRHETLMLPLTLTCARSLRSLAGGVELGLGWSGGGAELEVALAQS